MSFLTKLKAGAVLGAGLLTQTALAATDSKLNLRVGVTQVSREVHDLHMMTVWVMAAVAVVVFGAMAVAMVKFRRSAHPTPAKWSHSTLMEIVWTAIPFVILMVLAVPATKLLIKQYDHGNAEVEVVVRGYQWKWKYEYPSEGIEFFSNLSTPAENFVNDSHLVSGPISGLAKVLAGAVVTKGDKHTEKNENYLLEVDNELVLPVGKKIRFLITAEDVIHAFYMPDFAVKKDAIPGFVNESWTVIEKEGVYRGQCAELCGKDHGFMPIVVRAVSAEKYAEWIAGKKEEKRIAEEKAKEAAAKSWTMEQLMAEGEKAYVAKCAACHLPTGEGTGPFPALKGSKIALGEAKDHINIVVNGKAGTAMQAFGAQLTDAEIAAIITYERNAWGNNKGDLVQPADIAAFKQGN